MSLITTEELDAVHNHISNIPAIGAMYAPVLIGHCRALLAEIDRLQDAVEETEHQMHLRIRAGYDRTVADSWRAEVEKQSAAAYQRGAEDMREKAAQEVDRLLNKKKATAIWVAPDEIRALPLPT